MIDKLFDLGTVFDWITPTSAYVQDFFNGPVSDFGIPAHASYDRADIKHLLNSHGIRVWGLMYSTSEEIVMFSVPKAQAKWAYYLLQRERIPVLYAPAEATHSSKNPRKQANPSDPFEAVFNFLDNLEKKINL